MRLDRETIEIMETIIGTIIRPQEVQEIMACIVAEEEFRERFHEMRKIYSQSRDDLFDRRADVAVCLAEGSDPSVAQERRDQAEQQFKEQKLLMTELLDQCQHWATWSDGTCCVCGESL